MDIKRFTSSIHEIHTVLSSGISVAAFNETENGEEYLSFGQSDRIRRSSTLEEGWAWGWLDDGRSGWFPPDFWREVEDQHLSCPSVVPCGWFLPDIWREVEDQHLSCTNAGPCLDTRELLIDDDIAAGGIPVEEELQTLTSGDRDINISVVSFAGPVCEVHAHITDDIGTIWTRLKRESA